MMIRCSVYESRSLNKLFVLTSPCAKMKSVTFLAVFLFCVHLSLQIPKLNNCPPDFVLTSSLADECGILTCEGSGRTSSIGCGTWDCLPEKTVGYKQTNNSLPYPDCCGGPICID